MLALFNMTTSILVRRRNLTAWSTILPTKLVTPGAVIAEPGSDADLAIKPRDQVMIFGQDKARRAATPTG